MFFCLFVFDGKVYEQIDGVSMGTSLNSSLTNAFLCFHEQIWINDFLKNLNLLIAEVDDIFTLFYAPDRLEKLTNYLNSKPRSVNPYYPSVSLN